MITEEEFQKDLEQVADIARRTVYAMNATGGVFVDSTEHRELFDEGQKIKQKYREDPERFPQLASIYRQARDEAYDQPESVTEGLG